MEDKIIHPTIKKKAKTEVVGISYFYTLFIKSSLIKHQISFVDYKKVIYNYLKIYFFELYFSKTPLYFFLGGLMKITTYPSWSRVQKHGGSKKITLQESEKALGLFWHMIPSRKMYYMVKIEKLTGTTNMIPKIEYAYKQNNDKDLLTIFTEEKRRGKQDKTLYQCIQDWYPFKVS